MYQIAVTFSDSVKMTTNVSAASMDLASEVMHQIYYSNPLRSVTAYSISLISEPTPIRNFRIDDFMY